VGFGDHKGHLSELTQRISVTVTYIKLYQYMVTSYSKQTAIKS